MEKKKILYINPLGTDIYDEPLRKYLNTVINDSEYQVSVISLDRGPHHLEYYSYEALVLPDILKKIKKAENDSFDAAIIGCFYDPGVLEAREMCN